MLCWFLAPGRLSWFCVMWATGWLWTTFEQVVHKYVAAEGKAHAHRLALESLDFGLDNVEP